MKRRMLIGYAAVLCLVFTSCRASGQSDANLPGKGQQEESGAQMALDSGDPQQVEGEDGGAKGSGVKKDGAKDSGQEQGISIRAAKNLGAGSGLVTGRFFKAGDIKCGLTFELTEDGMDSDRLKCVFRIPDGKHSGYYDRMRVAEIMTESGKQTYEVAPETLEETPRQPAGSYNITFAVEDGLVQHIALEGDGGLAGEYYPFDRSFTFPDVFTRYLSKADLSMWPTENLWLLRNEIYAANARIFNSPVLKQYFQEKVWYRGTIGPEEFRDDDLSDVERKNVALIQQMENDPDRNKLDGQQYGLEDLPFAPYLPYLGKYSETGLDGDLAQAEDMGAYYVVQGELSVPASVSREQYQTVVDGGSADVILNELTGESKTLTLDPGKGADEAAYGFLLYEEGEDPWKYNSETGIVLDLDSGEYHLWQTSVDTVMKTVYKGDIYILKEAVHGSDPSLTGASWNQQDIFPSGYGQGEAPEYDRVFGNYLCYNMRGHFTAVYYLGD